MAEMVSGPLPADDGTWAVTQEPVPVQAAPELGAAEHPAAHDPVAAQVTPEEAASSEPDVVLRELVRMDSVTGSVIDQAADGMSAAVPKPSPLISTSGGVPPQAAAELRAANLPHAVNATDKPASQAALPAGASAAPQDPAKPPITTHAATEKNVPAFSGPAISETAKLILPQHSTDLKSSAVTAGAETQLAAPAATRTETHAGSKPSDVSSGAGDSNAAPASPNPAAVMVQPATNSGQSTLATAAASGVPVPPAVVMNQGTEPVTAESASRPQDTAPSSAPAVPAAPAVGEVQAARIVQGIGQSEMHIGLRTQAFGSVEVHTVVKDSQLGLTLGSERGDLRNFLAPEMAGLQSVFHLQELRFGQIRYLENASGPGAGFSGGSHSQSHAQSQSQSRQPSFPLGVVPVESGVEGAVAWEEPPTMTARLNVHA